MAVAVQRAQERPGFMAVHGADFDATGVVAWWELDGAVSRNLLEQAWQDAGLDCKLLPPPCSPEAALRLACASLAGRRVLLRPLAARGAWALVHEKANGPDDLEYAVDLRVSVAHGELHVTPDDSPAVPKLARAYADARRMVGVEAMSAWLVVLARLVHAVSLRHRGGLYFVPKDRAGDWQAWTGALRRVSDHRMYEMPALRTDEVVAAVLDGIERDTLATVQAMDAALDGLGTRGLRKQQVDCDAAIAKVAAYEGLLGRALPALHSRMNDLRARVAVALLTAQAQ